LVKVINELVDYTVMDQTLITAAEAPEKFSKKDAKLRQFIWDKPRNLKLARVLGDKKNPIIRKDNVVLYEHAASYCVIVILYDRKNRKGAMVHVENPTLALGTLQKTISEMYMGGSTNILAVAMGGNFKADAKAKRNWKAVKKVLKRNKNIVSVIKDYCVENVYVKYVFLWLPDGKVRGVRSLFGKSEDYTYFEFNLNKF